MQVPLSRIKLKSLIPARFQSFKYEKVMYVDNDFNLFENQIKTSEFI